jgi:hypothetical protein
MAEAEMKATSPVAPRRPTLKEERLDVEPVGGAAAEPATGPHPTAKAAGPSISSQDTSRQKRRGRKVAKVPCTFILPLKRNDDSPVSVEELAAILLEVEELAGGWTIPGRGLGCYDEEGKFYVDPNLEIEVDCLPKQVPELQAEVLKIGAQLGQKAMYFKVCPEDKVLILPVHAVNNQAPGAGNALPMTTPKRGNSSRMVKAPLAIPDTPSKTPRQERLAMLQSGLAELLGDPEKRRAKKGPVRKRLADKKRAA